MRAGEAVTLTFADGTVFHGLMQNVRFEPPDTMAVGPGEDAPRVVVRPGKITMELYADHAPREAPSPPLSTPAPEALEQESPDWGTWS